MNFQQIRSSASCDCSSCKAVKPYSRSCFSSITSWETKMEPRNCEFLVGSTSSRYRFVVSMLVPRRVKHHHQVTRCSFSFEFVVILQFLQGPRIHTPLFLPKSWISQKSLLSFGNLPCQWEVHGNTHEYPMYE